MAKRILFAEDNPEDRIPVAKYLRAIGWDVTEVFDPEQAIEILEENADTLFDVILLDLVMPENNPKGGEEVLAAIKKQDDGKRVTPVILATAWGYNGPAQRAKAIYPEAVKAILTKTFALRELSQALTSLIMPKGGVTEGT